MSIVEGSGKGRKDENFPVGSALIARRNRPVVLAFYRVARMADDVADHPVLSADEKLAQLALIEASIVGSGDAVAPAVSLRGVLAGRNITTNHILDLLEAFRRDAVKSRYASWAELLDYCRYSAAPVGRFMLDVHGESPALWPQSDALCAALQVINHLQDCARDYRAIDRVYVPADALAVEGLDETALAEPAASPALRRVIVGLANRTAGLLGVSHGFGAATRDVRIGLEIGVIQLIAERLARRLQTHDPLSQRVHLTPLEAFGCAAAGAGRAFGGRLFGRQSRAAAA